MVGTPLEDEWERQIGVFGASLDVLPRLVEGVSADRLRRVGVHLNLEKGDPEGAPYVAAFEQTLAQLGWVVGRNVQIDYRWTAGGAIGAALAFVGNYVALTARRQRSFAPARHAESINHRPPLDVQGKQQTQALRS